MKLRQKQLSKNSSCLILQVWCDKKNKWQNISIVSHDVSDLEIGVYTDETGCLWKS